MVTGAHLSPKYGNTFRNIENDGVGIDYRIKIDFKKTDKKRMLAIGDSIHHDIKGAMNFGIDSLLITSGIHKSIFNQSHLVWENSNNYLSEFKIKPTYLCSKFQF